MSNDFKKDKIFRNIETFDKSTYVCEKEKIYITFVHYT